MSLKAQAIAPIPEETVRVAHLVYPKGNRYLLLRDELGTLFSDEQFTALYPSSGQPAEAPWRLAMVAVMQYMEDYTDRQAAEAVRSRIDWKYVLSLELTDPGFDFSVLSEFRDRLLSAEQADLLFEGVLDLARKRGWLKERGKQRIASTPILGKLRELNRLECVGQTLCAALWALWAVVPAWLSSQIPADCYERYGRRMTEFRLPQEAAKREGLAEQIGADGCALRSWLWSEQAPAWLRELPAVEMLRQVWVQQYCWQEGRLLWRAEADLPPAAQLILSPYEPEARASIKRSLRWLGDILHVVETCDADAPHLIIEVQTTPATTQDMDLTMPLQQQLAAKPLLPQEQWLDTGYIDAGHLVQLARDYGVEVIGPVPPDPSWQARAGQGYDVGSFQLDFQQQVATCPQGHRSRSWVTIREEERQDIVRISEASADCLACPARSLCTSAKSEPRCLTGRPQAEHEALQAGRQRQSTAAFKERYSLRAGVEGTLSQGVRAFGFRQARYWGLAKTHLQHLLAATALNVARLLDWLDEVPRSTTRPSRFAALAT